MKIYNYKLTRYKFNSKELDQETGLYYYGARYYSPDKSIWLSVDPMSDKYPSMSPYMYCAGNPVRYIDPNGMEIGDYYDQLGNFLGKDQNGEDGKIHIVTNSEDIKRIKRNNQEGGRGTTNTKDVSSAITLPSKSVRQEMGKVIGMDMKNNLREYGGRVSEDRDGNLITLWAKPGPEYDGNPNGASIDLNDLSSTMPTNLIKNLFTFHSHLSGTAKGMQIDPTPSDEDYNNAKLVPSFQMHFEFGLGKGLGGGQVHLYDKNGYRASFPISSFLTLGK